MSRRDVIEHLAPVAPPCFADRLIWVEYLVAAAEAQSEKGQPSPLIFEAGKPVRFNPAIDFCSDCDGIYATVMTSQGRCKPEWLTQQPAKTLPQLIKEFLRAT